MNILLTGCTGNLGSHTLKALSEHGHHVRCLVRPSRKNRRKMNTWQRQPNVEIIWGDLWKGEEILHALTEQDVIVHIAFLIPPAALERPAEAERTNIQGMQNLLKGATSQEKPPKFLFASSYAVFGPEAAHKTELVKPDDPTTSTNLYTKQKLRCETMLKESGLSWSIFRFCDIIPLKTQRPTPLMYDIPLQTPMEFLHPDDAARAIVHGLERNIIWNRLWLIGGGQRCQIRFEDYLRRSLSIMGLDMLPSSAFNSEGIWGTGWLDTSESQQMLEYQRHTLDEIYHDVAIATSPPRMVQGLVKLTRPFIRKTILSYSPYYNKAMRKFG